MNRQILRGYNIICFGSEKWEYPGLQQTVMRHLSVDNKILYVNAIGLRKAIFRQKNIKIYIAKLKNIFGGTRRISDTVTVFSPLLIPVLYNDYIAKVNAVLLRRQFRKLLRDLNFKDYLLWAGTPTVAPFLGLFQPRLLIYNPVDRYSTFPFVDRHSVEKLQGIVAQAAHLVITTADAIKEDMAQYNKMCEVVGHGVLFDHFNRAAQDLEVPEDLKSLKKPVIGFFGQLSGWKVDFDLIRKVALHYINASILLIGRVTDDIALFSDTPNVHVIGFRKFASLPAYLSAIDVCIIPFHLNDLVEGVDPIKLREYLCAGKPVLTTNFREARKFRDLVYIALNHDEFIQYVGLALTENDPSIVQKRISTVRGDDWPSKMALISSLVLNALNTKGECYDK
jgi:glycosyltransferase involved in cell wall biosynthesis